MGKVLDHQADALQPRGEAFVHVVLEVTLAQLAQVGFARLSIPEIAAVAGVNKTSIYRRWVDKAALVRDALGTAMSHADKVPETGNLRQDLIALARTVGEFTQSQVGLAVVRVLLAEGGNPEVRLLANAAYQEAGRRGPWEVLARAGKRSELKKHIDPSLVLFTIAGAIMHRVFVEQRDVPDEFLEQLVDLVLFGAAARPGG